MTVEIGLVGQMVEVCIFQLDDGYDLAAGGTYGTIDQVRRDFAEFNSRYCDLATMDQPGTGALPSGP
jgi:hypothetical protein